MLRYAAGALTAAVLATAVAAQPPVAFTTPVAPAQHSPGIQWRTDNPLVLLGQKLFFDGRMSASGRTACASCHNPNYTYADHRRVSISDNGRPGRRNAPSLVDVGSFPVFMWDGRFRALEEQTFGPFHGGEMGIAYGEALNRVGSDPEYLHLFRTALNNPPMVGGLAHAISTFQRTLVSPDSRVDRFLMHNQAGILTPQERHGFDVFTRRAACSNCHQPQSAARPLFSDFQFHNLGIGFGPGGFADPGRYEHSKNSAEVGAFRTPSLRNVARTAPYMHDGSLTTLEEVVEFYNAGGRPNPHLSPLIRPLGLDPHEKAALVAFLRAMSDPAR